MYVCTVRILILISVQVIELSIPFFSQIGTGTCIWTEIYSIVARAV